jgi:primosomal protein N' (replication factor Y)
MNCLYCDAMMIYHKIHALPTGGVLRCHHCRAEQMLPEHCPVCAKKVTVFGVGTQRVEEQVEALLPGVRLLRMDSDTMKSAQMYQQALDAFGRGDVDVLVGTQMIAKGLDFPNVRLVGVISADTSLHIPDFRAAERTFQLIAQVAGRAGRGDQTQVGTVIVQTYNPDDPAIVLASGHDYAAFATREIELRHEAGLPPWSRMARIVVRDQDHQTCSKHAQELAGHIAQAIAQLGLGGSVATHGPAPCPIARIADYHRWQIEITASQPSAAATLQKLLTALRNARVLRSDAHTAVDVDPVMLM